MPGIQINEPLLDEKLAALEAARSWSPRVISKFEGMIRTAGDYDLFRINPVRYAMDKGVVENEAIALFLHATKAGIFEMEWHLVCPSCGHLVENLQSMANLHSHYVCDMCNVEEDTNLDEYIQVTFTISPQLRDIAFHHPDSLSVDDFYLKYQLCNSVASEFQGQKFTDVLRYFTKHLSYLLPNEKKTIELDLTPGLLRVNDIINNSSVWFFVGENPHPEGQTISVQLVGGQFHVTDRILSPLRLSTENFNYNFEQVGELFQGKVVMEVENLMDKKASTWISLFPAGFVPPRLEFEGFLSGKKLLSNQTFRDLYRFEVIKSPEGIGVKDLTYLFTDLKGSTELYELIGDPQAFYLVMQHFDALVRAVAAHSGAIVKTIGDAIMATFLTPVDAIGAAIDMLREIEAFNRGISQQLILKIGIHRGHSIAVTLNDRLDYFGQSVNIASRVQGLAGANEILVSRDVYTYSGVAELLAECNVASEERAAVKGVSEKIEVYRIIIGK